MAHNRKRYVCDVFDRLLSFSPIVGVFGHRQVGKSTFISSKVKEYRTLDDVDQLEAAQSNPKQFIQSAQRAPLAIDECQLEPKLFPTLKEWVRTRKKPGQFVLSGSVRFTSRKAIRESLAGRISMLELLPFSVTEIAGLPLSEGLVHLLEHKEFSSDSVRRLNPQNKLPGLKKDFEIYLRAGGLPGLCFIRNPEIRKSTLLQLHDLILSRDLRLINEVRTPLSTLKNLLSYISKQSFEAYNASEVRRLLGLSPQTQKNILYAMESVFLIRRIPIPLRKKEIILLEDQFEESQYSGGSLEPTRQLESAVYRNIRTQFAYRLATGVYFETYLTRDHARVPIVIQSPDRTLGIIITLGKNPALSETRSAASFLQKYSRAKVLYLSAEIIPPKTLNERSMLCSIYAVL